MDMQTIRDAQSGSAAAVDAVLAGCADIIEQVAREAARHSIGTVAGDADEYSQVARIALWEGVTRYTGSTVEGFRSFAYVTMRGACIDSAYDRRASESGGVATSALKDFARWVALCEGDVYEAERQCQVPRDGYARFLSDRARAVRIAFQGSLGLDAPAGGPTGESGETLLDRVAQIADVSVDLLEPEDLVAFERELTTQRVRGVLGEMSDVQAEVLRYTHGVEGRPLCGTEGAAEIARALGLPSAERVQVYRHKACASFAKRYAAVAGATPDERLAWLDAYDTARAERRPVASR
jgi:hypothetical protein